MEISNKEYQLLLEKITSLESEIRSTRSKKIKSIKEFMSEECDFSRIDDNLWNHIKGLAIAVHYKTNTNPSKHGGYKFLLHEKGTNQRRHDDLLDEELKLSAKVAEEILEIYNKYYKEVREKYGWITDL